MGYFCLYLLVAVIVFSVAIDISPRKRLRPYRYKKSLRYFTIAAFWPIVFIAIVLFISLVLSGDTLTDKGLYK